VAELAGHVVPAAHDLAVDDDADAEAVRHAEEDEIGAAPRLAAHAPRLGDGARAARVLDVDRQAEGPEEQRGYHVKVETPAATATSIRVTLTVVPKG